MNKAQIERLFIEAAFIDTRLPDTARPKKLKASWIGDAVALSDEDQRKWLVREKTDAGPSQLLKGDDPMKDWWLSFWDERTTDTSRKDVQLWELAMEVMTLVADAGNRRCLWSWAKAKVGTLEAQQTKTRKTIRKLGGERLKVHKRTHRDVSFKAWCKAEGIHEMTGTRRKNRAIAVIEQYLVRGSSPNNGSGVSEVLPVGRVFEHIPDMIGAVASGNVGPTFERDRDTVFAKEDAIFQWNEIRNADRRRRDALRREAKQTAA